MSNNPYDPPRAELDSSLDSNCYSRRLLTIEMLLLALPVFGFFLIFGIPMFINTALGNSIWHPISEPVAGLYICLLLFAFSKLAYGLITAKDLSKIVSLNYFWYLIISGIVYVIVGGIVTYWFTTTRWEMGQAPSKETMNNLLAIFSLFRLSAFGAPLVIPAIHMIFIRRKLIAISTEPEAD